MFASYGLYSMRKLVLSNCSLDKVDQQAFLELFSLEDLDLSTNFLKEVPSRSFANIPNLISLNLKKNPIKIIRFLDFVIFPHLKILDLSSCEISFISRHAFTGLFNLQQLSLNGNQLKTLKTEPNFPSSLQILNLGSNPWHCDCNLNLLRNLLLVPAEIQAEDPLCHSPSKVKGIAVMNVSLGQLTCRPRVTQTSHNVTVTTNRTAKMVCIVQSDPPARVTWIFKGEPLGENLSEHREVLTYSSEEGTVSKLVVHKATPADVGLYTCEAVNEAGEESVNYIVTVNNKSRNKSESELTSSHITIATAVVVIACVTIALVAVGLVKLARWRNSSQSLGMKKKKRIHNMLLPQDKSEIKSIEAIETINATLSIEDTTDVTLSSAEPTQSLTMMSVVERSVGMILTDYGIINSRTRYQSDKHRIEGQPVTDYGMEDTSARVQHRMRTAANNHPIATNTKFQSDSLSTEPTSPPPLLPDMTYQEYTRYK